MYYKIKKNIDLLYSKNKSKLIFYSHTEMLVLKLPSIYHINCSKNKIKFIFTTKFVYKSMISHIKNIICSFFKLRFVKAKIKGLGYTIKEITTSLHAFSFNWMNFIYLFTPLATMLKVYKRRFFLISKNWCLLKLVLNQLLGLKKVGPYELRGLRLVKHIILIKKKNKKA